MKSSTETLIKSLQILAQEIESPDGVANAAIAEAAERLRELSNDVLAKRIVELCSERDALRAQVEQLQKQKEKLLLGFDECKQMQNIADAEIKAQAGRDGFIFGARDAAAYIANKINAGSRDIDFDASTAASRYAEQVRHDTGGGQ